MKRSLLKLGAILGAAAVSTLAVAPAFAAAATSQATAQSIDLKLAGSSLIAQKQTATNDGTTETRNDNDTVPNLVGAIPGDTFLKAAVLPQLARANNDGTSFACAGLASDGNGGPGVVTVGSQSCDLTGSGAIPLELGSLALGDILLLPDTVISDALESIGGEQLQALLLLLGQNLNQLVGDISDALAGTPLGEIGVIGSLGTISAVCQANPDTATGDATLADSAIRLQLPDQDPITLVNLPVHPNENQKVVADLAGTTQMIVTALETYLSTIIQGQLDGPLSDVPQQVQDALLEPIAAGLKPLTDALAQYIAEITLRETTRGDNGRSIDVTALHAEILPALADTLGDDLVDGRIGRVTCGPNTRGTTPPGNPNTPNNPNNPNQPDVPDVVNSGLKGNEDHTARNVLGATAALMLLAGTAGLMGYRRMLNK